MYIGVTLYLSQKEIGAYNFTHFTFDKYVIFMHHVLSAYRALKPINFSSVITV